MAGSHNQFEVLVFLLFSLFSLFFSKLLLMHCLLTSVPTRTHSLPLLLDAVPTALANKGTKYSGLSAAWDWYATLSELAGVDPTDVRAAAAGLPPIDSISLVDVLLGNQGDDAGSIATRRTTLLLGTEPTDGFPLGTTVGGVITQDNGPSGEIWKLMVGPVKQSCWTSPTYPNATTNFNSNECVVNCTQMSSWTANGSANSYNKLGCLFRLDVDEGEYSDLGGSEEHAPRLGAMLDAIHTGRKNVRKVDFVNVRGHWWWYFAP